MSIAGDKQRCDRQGHSAAVLLIVMALTVSAPATRAPARSNAAHPSAPSDRSVTFQTSVDPLAQEDLAQACTYELTLPEPSRRVEGVWVIFERSRETLAYYQDADVRTFARRHGFALLFPHHCPSVSETGGDIDVDPTKGIGRALFVALAQLAAVSDHPEVATAKLILLGFSGTGSLVGRLAAFAPERMLAIIATNPGHFEPFGMDTINLSPQAAAVPQLVLAGSADAVSGTVRPYEYFRRHFDAGAPWTFVVQNRVPHCCILNARRLILTWLEAVMNGRPQQSSGRYGFIRTRPTRDTDCPGQDAPVRKSWCRDTKDAWGGENWSVDEAAFDRQSRSPRGMLPAGWLPNAAFASQWRAFVTRRDHPVTLPP
jgi:dienelactone hydrolase